MYGKIFASLYQGTLRGKAHEILVFTNMIACCDRHGEVDKHPRAIADEVGLTVEQVNAAIQTLEAPDPESRSREHNGARIIRLSDDRTWGWVIVNYIKYRQIRDQADRREQTRLAVARHRAKTQPSEHVIQCNPDVSQGKPRKAHADADAHAEKDNQDMPDKSGECAPVVPPVEQSKASKAGDPVEPAMFEVFWNDYAKKRDRAAVVKYWNRMSAEDRHLAYDGVLRYVKANPDPQYRKDPIRYLRNRSWEDEAITHEPGQAQTVEQAAKECPHPPGSYEAMDWWVMNYPWFIPGCDVPNPNTKKASA